MAQQLITVTTCDRHLIDKDTEEPGEAWAVSIQGPGDKKPTTLAVDACAECDPPLREALAFLVAYGRNPGTNGRRRAARAVQPEPEPEPEAEPEAGPTVYTCEVCDRWFTTPQGRNLHQTRKHPAE